MNKPWFFFSYSRTDSIGSEHLKTFYSDLVREVRREAGLRSDTPEAEVGFLDARGIATGETWSEEVSAALRTCRSLICIYSRGYFGSEYCGREFKLFSSRIDEYVRGSQPRPKRPGLIFPVLWHNPLRLPKKLPPAVSQLQYTDDFVGSLYAQEGLYFLMKLNDPRYRDEYNLFLLRLAARIVERAETYELPDLKDDINFLDVEDAFASSHAAGATGESSLAGPGSAHFVYVAGRRAELGRVRKKVDCYGEEGHLWRPYHPKWEVTAGLISQTVATNEGLHYERVAVGDDLVAKLREAEQRNAIVVIVVDAWSIQLEEYKNRMLDFDSGDFLNCGVLIPLNEDDEETSESKEWLQSDAKKVFKRKFILNTAYFRDSIASPQELEKEICNTITEVRRRLLLKADVEKSVSRGGDPMPTLSNSAPPSAPSDTL